MVMNWNGAVCALQCISCYSDWFGKFVPSTIRNQSCTKPTQTNHKLVLWLCTDYTTNNVYLLIFSGIQIGHVRYINILTWLQGFQVKPLYLVLFSLYQGLFCNLRDKGNLKNLQFWPESLRAMLEYWYIALLHYLHFFRSTNVSMIKISFDLVTLKWKSIL